mmetsp:Transcript_62903/g.142161  ORF Transcript_62903/g.142161 Transcript_62903/m.142161 type:complete len:229 (-) Transcript_62903:4-690(-)
MLPSVLCLGPREGGHGLEAVLLFAVAGERQIPDVAAELLHLVGHLDHVVEQVFVSGLALLASSGHAQVRLEVDGLLVHPEEQPDGAVQGRAAVHVQLALQACLQLGQLLLPVRWPTFSLEAGARQEAALLRRLRTQLLPVVPQPDTALLSSGTLLAQPRPLLPRAAEGASGLLRLGRRRRRSRCRAALGSLEARPDGVHVDRHGDCKPPVNNARDGLPLARGAGTGLG